MRRALTLLILSAGAVMLLVGGISYLAGGLGLTAKLLRTPAMASRGRG